MLTPDRQRKNRATFIELKSANNFSQKQQWLQKLGGGIRACITRLQNLRGDIERETDLRKISLKVAEFQKANNEYNELQLSLAQIDDQSQKCLNIKRYNSSFLETYHPEQIKKKLNMMREERTAHIRSQDTIEMTAFNQQQLRGELLYEDKYAIRKRILEQEKVELQQIERLLGQVKEIAEKTSIMITEQGQSLVISLQTMQKANRNLKDANKNLCEANEYQQDTNKKLITFCCLTVVIVSIIVMIIYSSSNRGA